MLKAIEGLKDGRIFEGEHRKLRLEDGLATSVRLCRPVVRMDHGELHAEMEVRESVEADPLGVLSFEVPGRDLITAYRAGSIIDAFSKQFNRKSFESSFFVPLLCDANVPPEMAAKVADIRVLACKALGIDAEKSNSFHTIAPPQQVVETFYGQLKAQKLNFTHAPLLHAIRQGQLRYSKALEEMGLEDPADIDVRAAHTKQVTDPLLPQILHVMHLLHLPEADRTDVTNGIGVAYRKGVSDPAAAIGIATYQMGVERTARITQIAKELLGDMEVDIKFLGSSPVISLAQISAALAVVFSDKTLDDHHRMLKAILDSGYAEIEKK
jgi:hypothetical protein